MPITSVVALVIGVVACVSDIRTRRIPNLLTFGGAAAGLLFHLLSQDGSGLLHATLGWAIGIGIFFLPFALGGMGAGDVKLMGALGAWLGPVGAVWLALYAGVAGGVAAILLAIGRGYLKQALANVGLLLAHWQVFGLKPVPEITLEGSRGPKLAYAVPILIGTLVTVWRQ